MPCSARSRARNIVLQGSFFLIPPTFQAAPNPFSRVPGAASLSTIAAQQRRGKLRKVYRGSAKGPNFLPVCLLGVSSQ